MQQAYDASAVEPKWQKKWEELKAYEVDLKKAKDPYYSMVMWPYPSGDKLHVGHWYNFGPADSYSRFMRMQGKDVFTPMGFDAFGLPAENYAVKTGIHPTESIAKNVETMIAQLKRMGCMYDWSKSENSSAPSYYKWTQWVFLKLFEHDLAFRKKQDVNFCPKCQTVLANEQCQDGKCERCESEVEQKPMTQWFFRITKYADRLVDGLESIDWPEKTKTMQRHWIGRKHGINIVYEVKGSADSITCFTTRPDTNFGATFIVVAPEHAFAQKVAKENPEVAGYIQAASKKSELERQEEGRKKTGVFTGHYAVNNLSGYEMPIWVSDFVLGGFGTGAVVGVPGHDLRDFEFAETFGIPVLRVVVGPDGDTSKITKPEQVQEDAGTMVNSDFLDGMEIMAAKEKIMDHIAAKGWGEKITTYRLRDWSISRQRYWGAPIPIVYDPEGNPHPIPEEHLPWLLPTDVEFKPTGTAPLAQSKELKVRTEKLFGKGWTPEVDTMDTFVCSSFYQFMYLSTEGVGTKSEARSQKSDFIDPKIEKKWMPVDMYIGGAEHACMHLIYARFVTMALKDFGFVQCEEPFKKLVHQGIITNQGAKMSKSKGNVVSPDAFVERHGADVFRMYLMFMGPFTDGGDWSDTGIKGIDRFVQRMWKVLNKRVDQCSPQVRAKVHATVKKCTEDIPALRFNTAIAALMELLNDLEKQGGIAQEGAEIVARLLAPLAPHLAEELWESIGGQGFVIDQPWPEFDPALLKTDSATVAVQVNGKVRGQIEVATDAAEAEVIAQAKEEPNVAKHLEGKQVRKAIYVKGRLVSLVVS
ncbi:MAG: leucine--tRNA ligase [Candidatus Peribacteraceae bacterium]|nr:leucine--tRNA ligase [Candidatus Peribacteraceae bacterium]